MAMKRTLPAFISLNSICVGGLAEKFAEDHRSHHLVIAAANFVLVIGMIWFLAKQEDRPQ